MAEVLEDFDFKYIPANRKYPWGDWLDGRVWKLQKGEDFTCLASTVVTQAHIMAENKGGHIISRIMEKKSVAVIQFHKGERIHSGPIWESKVQGRP